MSDQSRLAVLIIDGEPTLIGSRRSIGQYTAKQPKPENFDLVDIEDEVQSKLAGLYGLLDQPSRHLFKMYEEIQNLRYQKQPQDFQSFEQRVVKTGFDLSQVRSELTQCIEQAGGEVFRRS